jgi:hypothetical protein
MPDDGLVCSVPQGLETDLAGEMLTEQLTLSVGLTALEVEIIEDAA